MSITTTQFSRKPLTVDAVNITSENFEEVAAWCQGEIYQDEVDGQVVGKKYIKVRVHNPKNRRQTKAFVGDWLLYTERGYKIYTNRALYASFDRVVSMSKVEPTELMAAPEQLDPRPTIMAPPQIAVRVPPAPPKETVETAPVQEKIEPAAAEGKRVLSVADQNTLSDEEIREMVQSGQAVLAQDIAAA